MSIQHIPNSGILGSDYLDDLRGNACKGSVRYLRATPALLALVEAASELANHYSRHHDQVVMDAALAYARERNAK